jgi:hypothetical protein
MRTRAGTLDPAPDPAPEAPLGALFTGAHSIGTGTA